MLINKSLECENGSVKFEGELSPEELDLVLQMGLNALLARGAIPFTSSYDRVVPNKSEYPS